MIASGTTQSRTDALVRALLRGVAAGQPRAAVPTRALQVLNSLRMRTDILPLCDQHYRTMEPALAPYNADYSIEFFRCTDKFCHRCFGERVGYSTPKRGDAPVLTPNQPICERHGRPMFIISLDRQRNHITYACPESDCGERVVRT